MVRTRQTASRMVSMGVSSAATGKKTSCRVGNISGAGASSSSLSHCSTPSSTPSKTKFTGGNPVYPRETPTWQKEITCFFQVKSDEISPSSNDNGDDNEKEPQSKQEIIELGSSCL